MEPPAGISSREAGRIFRLRCIFDCTTLDSIMNRRFRFVGAFLALSALSASYAEGLWAFTACGDMEGIAAEQAMASMDGMEGMADMAMGGMDHSMSPSAAPSDRTSGDEGSRSMPDCPLVAIAGTCTAASLPTSEPRVSLGSISRSNFRPAPDARPELLLSSSLLRPPRA